MTCRCLMCGGKNAGKKVRNHYLRMGISTCEAGKNTLGLSKRETHKLFRTRSKRELVLALNKGEM